ncbi:MAG: pyridoxal phosphate-dependent aminotransferase [Candidatus Levybacteria bacterium]|nr:pyridoxal phosphate-dependent aminotransferase [Candidatus Levybacteria bacterium]
MISDRAQQICPSATLAMNAKALEMRKLGIDVISFGAGEPDFDTPEHIKKAAIEAISAGFTKYTPTSGIPELKQAIIAKFQKDNDLIYTNKQILVSNGAKQSLYVIIQTIINPGDEVIIPVPYWVSYEEMVKLASGKCVFVPSGKNFIATANQIRKHVTKKTKAIILNSPSNPTGAVYDKETLKEIAALCCKYNIYVLSDEIYEKLIYTKKHVSIASFGEEIKKQTIVINGVSKTYAMTVWRIGYCGGPEDIIKAASSLQDHMTSSPNSIAQKAAVAALKGSFANLEKMRKVYVKRRDYMVKRLKAIKGVSVSIPDGAFYVFADISSLYKNSLNSSALFCEQLLIQQHVAAVPGSAFGDDRFIRLSFATDMQSIIKGLDRIESFVQSISKPK